MRADASLTITTSRGKVAGSATADVARYLGIPYALPPFGEHRFALPQPVPAWEGVRDATAFGPTTPQDPYFGELSALLGTIEIPGDDILTVNVWTPAGEPPPGGWPVMVWYHGGALERGAAALPGYDGTSFARSGVVFVSVGHRVGAEGFSVLEGAPRNLGLADAAAGLQWVQREIPAFGGDAARITVFGESAGGALVAALLCRPDTAGIPRAAVIQSGPLDASSPENAGRVTKALAKALGVPATRAAFAALTPRQLLDARRRMAEGSTAISGTPGYQLAVDAESLPVSPAEGLRSVTIPIVIGTNTDEYRLWLTPAELAAISPLKLRLALIATKVRRGALGAYRAALPGASAGELLGQIVTDRLLRAPAVRLARARTAPTFVYEFAWRSPVRELWAAHAVEIAFVFDGVRTDSAAPLVGDAPPQALADRMHRDWVSFARDLDPGWRAWAADEPVMRFDVDSAEVPLPRAAAIDALGG